MASTHSAPEIRTEAFIAAREKCALSVEALAQLACLSKKQIQQIENGQSSTFYSPAVKLTAAKKVAKLIKLDEKDAFDFGPQAELPFVQAADVTQTELSATQQESPVDAEKEAPKKEGVQSSAGESKKAKKASSRIREGDAAPSVASQTEAKPIVLEAVMPEPSKQNYSDGRERKSSGKKWVWLLPAVALVFALVQFQPLLRDSLDAAMGKAKPVEEVALSSAPAVDPAPSNLPATEASPAPAPAAPALPPAVSSPSPVTAVASGCPPVDGAIESYKPSSAGKPGNFVFVRVNSAQLLCVIDADGLVQSKTVEPGAGYSFYGKPPFKLLSSAALGSAEVFFQGFRIRPNTADMKGMLLVRAD
jgi:DNA-binding XRE family transcriptional regulator